MLGDSVFIVANDIIVRLEASGTLITPDAQAALMAILPGAIRAVEKAIGFRLLAGTITEYFPSGVVRPTYDAEAAGNGWEKIGSVVMPRGGFTTRAIQLRYLPVRTITSIHVNPAAWTTGDADGDWPAATLQNVNSYQLELTEGSADFTGVVSDTGIVYRVGYDWPATPRSTRIIYTYGFSDEEMREFFPEVIEAIAITAMVWLRDWIARSRSLMNGNVQSVSIEDFSVSFGENFAASGGAGSATAQKSAIPAEAARLLNDFVNVSAFFGS